MWLKALARRDILKFCVQGSNNTDFESSVTESLSQSDLCIVIFGLQGACGKGENQEHVSQMLACVENSGGKLVLINDGNSGGNGSELDFSFDLTISDRSIENTFKLLM